MSLKSLVRSTVVLGSTSLASTAIGILRVKILALLIGPSGMGLLGALAGIASVGTILAASGSDTAGTRQLALGRNDPERIGSLRLSLLLIAAVHGLAAMGAIYLMREEIAQWVFGDAAYAATVGWLGFGVLLSLLAGLQITQLQGLGRVGDVARVTILASMAGSIAGVAAVCIFGIEALILVVLAQPAASVAAAAWFTSRLPGVALDRQSFAEAGSLWRGLVTHGTPYMLSFLMLTAVPLIIRALVIQTDGLPAAGHFHASWTISLLYIGFLMSAMSADFFPRLTGVAEDRVAANSLINQQTQLCLSIGGPIILVMLAGAPWFVPLLYSSAFAPAVPLLEWQSIGNILKIAAWPLTFLAMARGRPLQYLLIEALWSCVFLALAWHTFAGDLVVIGQAFTAAAAVYILSLTLVNRLSSGFRWEPLTLLLLAATIAGAVATLAAAQHSPYLQAGIGTMTALGLGLAGIRLLLRKLGTGGGRRVDQARALFARAGWPVETA